MFNIVYFFSPLLQPIGKLEISFLWVDSFVISCRDFTHSEVVHIVLRGCPPPPGKPPNFHFSLQIFGEEFVLQTVARSNKLDSAYLK